MKKLPIIRHVRYFWLLYQVNRHYQMWAKFGMLPVYAESDYATLDRVWRGEC
jgi:hypothetical protein